MLWKASPSALTLRINMYAFLYLALLSDVFIDNLKNISFFSFVIPYVWVFGLTVALVFTYSHFHLFRNDENRIEKREVQ